MAKAKKGVMPPALKKYWAKHRRGKKTVATKKKRRVRRKNPSGLFKLVAKKGSQRLTFNGMKFSSSAVGAVLFSNKGAAQAIAQRMVNQHPSLRTYKFYAIPG